MGFDLSGCKPKINVKLNDVTVYGMIQSIENFKERMKIQDALSEEEREEYWEQHNQHHKANPGVYFRNSVWWWRPLWNFVCNCCEDILSDKDVQAGSYNDGYKISKTKAKKMSKRLYGLLKDGMVNEYEDYFKEQQKKSSKSKDGDEKFFSQYPFDSDNVERFALFCEESGGFIIC